MTEPNQKDEDIVIRTMKSDLEDLNNPRPKKEKEPIPVMPAGPISQEAQYNISQAPTLTTLPKMGTKAKTQPPILIIPPKIIPPKEFPEIPTKPLYKATPAWIKLGTIGFSVILIVFLGLYGYWKIFIQSQPPTIVPPIATTTIPTLPITSTATTTAPIKFFNKLPHKTITIDLSAKTPSALTQSLKSEAKVEEIRASVKQIKITFDGKPLSTAEFIELLSIFTPRDFLNNYESEYALGFFNQKEGARPILMLKSKNRELAKTQMKEWERTTFGSDIFPLFLTNFKLPATLPSFRSYLFIGQPVRYLNVNVPFASLNYAIYNDFLIFTTSSASMFVVLQDLTGQSVSLEYLKSLGASINEFVK